MAFASYNRFHNPLIRDTLCLSLLNSVTSLIAGIIVFAALGHTALVQSVPIDQAATDGNLFTLYRWLRYSCRHSKKCLAFRSFKLDAMAQHPTNKKTFYSEYFLNFAFRFEFVIGYVFDGRVTNAIPTILERLPLPDVYFPWIRYAGMIFFLAKNLNPIL